MPSPGPSLAIQKGPGQAVFVDDTNPLPIKTVAAVAPGQPSPQMAGSASTSRIVFSGADNAATLAKGSAASLYSAFGYNAAAAVRYLKLYNKATAPNPAADGALIVFTLALPPSSAFAFDFAAHYFPTGLAYAIVTGSADNNNGLLTAGDILGFNLAFL